MNKKAYVYISLICVISLFFSCLTTNAASISASWTSGYNTNVARAILINQYTVDYEFYESQSASDIYPLGNYNVYVYELTIAVKVGFNTVDGYVNGYTTGTISYSASTPTGYNLYAIDAEYTPFNPQGLYSVDVSTRTSTGNASTLRAFANNFWAQYNGATEIGNIKVRFTLTNTATPTNVPDPPEYISISVGASQVNSVLNASTEPQDQGFATVIKESIINALNDVDNPIQDLLTYIQNTNSILTDIYNHNEAWYAEIVDELLANNQWNSTITDELIALYQELSINTNATINIASYTADLRSFMQTFPTWSSQVLTLLSKLAEMNAAQQTEAAAIASQYDSLQQQQDNANAIIEGVSRPTFAQGQFNANNLVPQGQRGTFTGFLALITSNNYITTILIIVMTFATAGFVLFGKKK